MGLRRWFGSDLQRRLRSGLRWGKRRHNETRRGYGLLGLEFDWLDLHRLDLDRFGSLNLDRLGSLDLHRFRGFDLGRSGRTTADLASRHGREG